MVRDEGHFPGVSKNPGDEVFCSRAQVVFIVFAIERVHVPVFENGEVGVHPASILSLQWLRHKCGEDTATASDLLHQVFMGLEGIGHLECCLIPDVDLMLGRSNLSMVVFHRDPHGLQGEHRHLTDVVSDIDGVDVEISGLIQDLRIILVVEVEKFRLRTQVHVFEAAFVQPRQLTLKHDPGMGGIVGPVRVPDFGEHADGARASRPEGRYLDRRGDGHGHHVALLDPLVTLDRGSVETHPLFKSPLELLRCDGEGLQKAQHVGEPQSDGGYAVLLHIFEDVLRSGH